VAGAEAYLHGKFHFDPSVLQTVAQKRQCLSSTGMIKEESDRKAELDATSLRAFRRQLKTVLFRLSYSD